jgi:hypothetical protein
MSLVLYSTDYSQDVIYGRGVTIQVLALNNIKDVLTLSKVCDFIIACWGNYKYVKSGNLDKSIECEKSIEFQLYSI